VADFIWVSAGSELDDEGFAEVFGDGAGGAELRFQLSASVRVFLFIRQMRGDRGYHACGPSGGFWLELVTEEEWM
jgi:hypothetical protein